jgi:hypothetical protein
MNRKCLTSGMVIHTEISEDKTTIVIDHAGQKWDEDAAKQIDDRLHDGVEYALAPFWR